LSGLASFEAVRQAARLAARGLVSAVVTAPISKRAWSLAEIPFADHTDFFGALAQHPVDMILGSQEKEIWCCLATRHVALRRVAGSLSVGGVVSAAASLNAALRRLGLRRPRLGLCALNPHAGEEGLLGVEEKRILLPAVALARRRGIDLIGPLPADTAWRWHVEGLVGGLVALYHDQALVPIKAVCGLSAVNWTAGLPFVRTSPAHGTGFDIAGRKKADFSATLAAARLAARLLKNGKSRR
jgi:4-hydroxythreonine-4-phosphate dehydrogenase